MPAIPTGSDLLLWLLPLLRLSDSLTLTSVPRSQARDAYFWPNARGRPGSYSASPYQAPRDLSQKTLAWKWNITSTPQSASASPLSQFWSAHASSISGILIDDEKDIYVFAVDGVRKLSSDGELIWFTPMMTWRIGSLRNGTVYTTTELGHVVALSMETGQELWSSKFTQITGPEISALAIEDNVIIAESLSKLTGGGKKLAGLDATDGHKLWEISPDNQLWNVMPMATGNGTFIMQDQAGGVYHIRAKDGHRIWKSGFSGEWGQYWSDGMAMLADGVVYAVHSDGGLKDLAPTETSNICAYDLATGQKIWRQDFPFPTNTQAAVGYLGKGAGLSDRLSVVVPIGAQPIPTKWTYNSSIRVFDAKTGAPQWEWTPPTYRGGFVPGDVEDILHAKLPCLPNPYGSASIDARGTVYLGHFNGKIYAIRDDNGDGRIDDSEVSEFYTGAGFSHGGVAIAPSMMAIASCDTVYVFED
mmetsp:Transcript_91063/g.202165  ORF Transcript_91063/g.202165 Transcript_91063/m.202165 type:complete len:473 (-) Transcript_91063:32-1450(-)